MAPRFGTSGLRGLASDLTDALCARYAEAFLAVTPHSGRLLVALDLRPSSRRILRAVAAGARAAGVEVTDCGEIPTPALALEAESRAAPAIMITGSHIPADRNGLKFYTPTGEITKSDEAAIGSALHAAFFAHDVSDPPFDAGAAQRYRERYRGFFAPGLLNGRRIGVFQHSSVGRDLLVDILCDLGATIEPLGRSDDFVAIDTEALPADLRDRLAGWAEGRHPGADPSARAAARFDAIVSLDGDGDRPLVTDATGTPISGDILGVLAARHLGASHVVTPVSSNTMLEATGAFRVTRTRIGSPHVIAGIRDVLAEEQGARVVGYEANGGFLSGFHATGPSGGLVPLLTRDAVLPILCALAGGDLSATLAAMPPRRTAADLIADVPGERGRALVAALSADPSERARLTSGMGPEVDVDLTDGLRMTFASREILHLRVSGNAPDLRCYGEADDLRRAKEIVALCLARLGERLG